MQFSFVYAVCAAGYGSNDDKVTSCAPCQIDIFKARPDLRPCEPCGPGTTNTQEGSTACDGESYQFACTRHTVEFLQNSQTNQQTNCERLKSQNRVSTEHEADWQSWQAVSSSTGYK